MEDVVHVTCPYCQQSVELYVDPETEGAFVEDCEVCCRPWRVQVWRDEDGQLGASVDRAQ